MRRSANGRRRIPPSRSADAPARRAAADAAVKFSDRSWRTYLASNAAWAGILASILCAVCAANTFSALRRVSRRQLGCTLVVAVLLIAFQITASVITYDFAVQLNVGNPNTPSGSYTSFKDIVINNFVYSIYQRCCSGCPVGCNNTSPGAYANYTLPNCAPPLNECEVPQLCTGPTDNNCFVYPASHRYAIRIPPLTVSTEVCDDLSYLTMRGIYIVGPANTGACGGGSPGVFLSVLADYVDSSMYGVAVVNIIVLVTLLSMIAFAVYIIAKGYRGTMLKGAVAEETEMGYRDFGAAARPSRVVDAAAEAGGGAGAFIEVRGTGSALNAI